MPCGRRCSGSFEERESLGAYVPCWDVRMLDAVWVSVTAGVRNHITSNVGHSHRQGRYEAEVI